MDLLKAVMMASLMACQLDMIRVASSDAELAVLKVVMMVAHLAILMAALTVVQMGVMKVAQTDFLMADYLDAMLAASMVVMMVALMESTQVD